MDQLIKQVTDRTGITEDQATQAVETVLTLLKDRLQAGPGSQLDGLLGGEMSSLGSIAGGVQDTFGGLFGKRYIPPSSHTRQDRL